MLIVHVHIHVKPEFVEAFEEATLENARNSVREPGIARFEVLQQADDPHALPADGDLSRRRGAGAPQGDGALCEMARYGGRHDGGTAHARQIHGRFSPMSFEFATAGRIVFGAGTFAQLGWNRAPDREAPVRRNGQTRSGPLVAAHRFPSRASPPSLSSARASRRFAAAACDLVIAIGGGSAIDAGKAIAAAAANAGDLLDYLEVIGKGRPLDAAPYPFIAVPTTAGTGSEVTRNAVLGSPEHGVKVSLRSPLMLPRVAIVDPELTRSLPPAVTASTGLDALTQLIESLCLHTRESDDGQLLPGRNSSRFGQPAACVHQWRRC